jgi:catechol 2,3-dioxygenase-like lactoylglutathione lyase family enzyme
MLTGIFRKQAPKYPINPRFRAYGKARLDIARRAATGSDWDRLWKEPAFPFPFDWGEWWKQCIEYKVEDFAAEVGFYTDILGLPVVAFDPNYAMFTSPAQDFFLAVVPAFEPGKSTPPDALRIQFMVADIFETVRELQRRGIVFEQKPRPCEQGSSMYITYFRTPHGLCVDLWGNVSQEEQLPSNLGKEPEESNNPQGPSPGERGIASTLSYEVPPREIKLAEPEGLFEDGEADEDEAWIPASETGLRFFVEPAGEFSETDEIGANNPAGGLTFGIGDYAEVSHPLWSSSQEKKVELFLKSEEDFSEEDFSEEDFGEEDSGEKALGEGNSREDNFVDKDNDEIPEAEDDDSSPYEYVDVDDI